MESVTAMQQHSWYQTLFIFCSYYSPFFKQIELFLQKAHSLLVKLYPWLELLGIHVHVMMKERTWRALTDLPLEVSAVILKFCSVRRSRGISVNQSCGEAHSIIWRGHNWECSWLRAVLKMGKNGMNIFCSPSCQKIPHKECGIWISEGNNIKKKSIEILSTVFL